MDTANFDEDSSKSFDKMLNTYYEEYKSKIQPGGSQVRPNSTVSNLRQNKDEDFRKAVNAIGSAISSKSMVESEIYSFFNSSVIGAEQLKKFLAHISISTLKVEIYFHQIYELLKSGDSNNISWSTLKETFKHYMLDPSHNKKIEISKSELQKFKDLNQEIKGILLQKSTKSKKKNQVNYFKVNNTNVTNKNTPPTIIHRPSTTLRQSIDLSNKEISNRNKNLFNKSAKVQDPHLNRFKSTVIAPISAFKISSSSTVPFLKLDPAESFKGIRITDDIEGQPKFLDEAQKMIKDINVSLMKANKFTRINRRTNTTTYISQTSKSMKLISLNNSKRGKSQPYDNIEEESNSKGRGTVEDDHRFLSSEKDLFPKFTISFNRSSKSDSSKLSSSRSFKLETGDFKLFKQSAGRNSTSKSKTLNRSSTTLINIGNHKKLQNQSVGNAVKLLVESHKRNLELRRSQSVKINRIENYRKKQAQENEYMSSRIAEKEMKKLETCKQNIEELNEYNLNHQNGKHYSLIRDPVSIKYKVKVINTAGKYQFLSLKAFLIECQNHFSHIRNTELRKQRFVLSNEKKDRYYEIKVDEESKVKERQENIKKIIVTTLRIKRRLEAQYNCLNSHISAEEDEIVSLLKAFTLNK